MKKTQKLILTKAGQILLCILAAILIGFGLILFKKSAEKSVLGVELCDAGVVTEVAFKYFDNVDKANEFFEKNNIEHHVIMFINGRASEEEWFDDLPERKDSNGFKHVSFFNRYDDEEDRLVVFMKENNLAVLKEE